MVTQVRAAESAPSTVSRVLARLGWVPLVTVRGRRTGRPRRSSLAPVTHDGQRYLVAVRGNTDWARNLAAAGEGELRSRQSTQSFSASEVGGAEREAVLAAYERSIGRWMGISRIPGWPAASRVFRIRARGQIGDE